MIPSWLALASSESHVETVLSVLTYRERERAKIRSISHNKAAHPNRLSIRKPLLQKEYYSVSVGSHPDHKRENRYVNLEAYDRTRVVFDAHGVADSSIYLNGNWVREFQGGKWWIATQAPLPNTTHTFLNVLLQPLTPPYTATFDSSPDPSTLNLSSFPRRARVRTIVQLTRDKEGGIRKGHRYFPPNVGESNTIPGQAPHVPSVRVALVETRQVEEANCLISTISIAPILDGRYTAEPITINHLLYTEWPDHGAPEGEDRERLIKFICLVDEINRQPSTHSDEPDPPAMVHCSAGIGRTGTFIVLASLLRVHGFLPLPPLFIPALPTSPLGLLPQEIASDLVAQEIDWCREQRAGAVQGKEQILLIYDCLSRVLLRRA